MSVVVVGAGQAGLAVSRELSLAGVEHVVLERGRIAQAWRDRWDSFTLVTPNWTLDLPGSPYDGDDPEGHVARDEIVDYLERYATGSVREGVRVDGIQPGSDALLHLETSEGPFEARAVVVCSGAYQKPYRPPAAAGFPESVEVLDAMGYRNPDQLPPGRVLVVGSGQTGVQLAEELDLAGHDLHYRVLNDLGVELAGHLETVADGVVRFADDLARSVAFGDARYDDMRRFVRDRLGASVADHLPDAEPFRCVPTESLPISSLGAMIFTSGFRPDYRSLVQLPVFDDLGFPVVEDDLTTAVPGLYFCGVHFLRTRSSSLLFGVGADAAIVATAVAAGLS